MFQQTLSVAAGVYDNGTTLTGMRHPLLSKTVVMTLANYGFMNHLHNLLCHTDRLGYKVVVISLDVTLHNQLSKMPGFGEKKFSILWDGGQMTKGLLPFFSISCSPLPPQRVHSFGMPLITKL
jgi:hypothetical protein